MDNNIKIRLINKTEIDDVAKIIAEGYHNDVFFKWCVSDDIARKKIVTEYYKIYLSANGCVAHVAEAINGDIVGATVWLPHDVDASIYDDIDKVAGDYSPQFRAVCDLSHFSEPPMSPFYQLVGFVVVNNFRGTGIGKALLEYQLCHLDKLGIPTYLEASTPYYGGGVYGYFGYLPVGELMVFTPQAVLYPLWREADNLHEQNPRLGEACNYHGNDNSIISQNVEISFGGYMWKVIAEDEGKLLLLAKDVIKLMPYHNSLQNITWESCDIRQYLNGEFLSTFSTTEQQRIIPIDLCYKTADKVFLLSINEATHLFNTHEEICRDKFYVDDANNVNRIAKYLDGKPSRWLLRTEGRLRNFVSVVTINGRISISGDFVNRQSTELFNVGVRPAMWAILK